MPMVSGEPVKTRALDMDPRNMEPLNQASLVPTLGYMQQPQQQQIQQPQPFPGYGMPFGMNAYQPSMQPPMQVASPSLFSQPTNSCRAQRGPT